jgi:single-stranded DNA-binding protein|tara:strand:+ start:6602 stop:6934 length:333 start_codon:yes stop_codon:yes gene_type:complete
MNQVTLVGRLGKDAEQNGKTIKFSIATSEKVKGEDKTEWHNVVLVNANDKVLDMLKKGALVACTGKITYSKTDRGFYTNILCYNVKILVYADTDYSNKVEYAAQEDNLPF